ncbi:hypothetical protein E3N88_33178 [Mikania micrantha]|uniref:DUF4219 domain-containing protein n=1 Tax=Mikania micrantha TaxID=192012 RepID=A0A5N6MD73_9ASTR|nr:hypothetical protein E3N88_33178 [Mikania micrantha]
MAALNKHDTENGTLNKPPMFTPEDFDTWKVRMEGFIRNQDFKLWKSVLEGPYIPTVAAAGAGVAAVPKDPSMYSDEDYKKMEVDSKALWLIQMSIPNSIIHAFKKCKSAQELWNSLKQMYEGSEDVKENKKDMLKQKFENFCQQNNENMSSQYLRYVQLVDELTTAGVTLDNQDVLRKFLRSLPKAWNIYSVTIRRTENLKTLTLGELFGILSAYQMELDAQESKVSHLPSGSAALYAPINNPPYQSYQPLYHSTSTPTVTFPETPNSSNLWIMKTSLQQQLPEKRTTEDAMPWVGLYCAVASSICTLAMAADVVNGFWQWKLWFPNKIFTLNATTITLIAIAMKLPVDLTSNTSSVYGVGGIENTKITSIFFLITMLGNFLPSLGLMDDKELLTNIVALGILISTIIVNIFIQTFTQSRLLSIVDVPLVVLPILLPFSIALTVSTSRKILEQRYKESQQLVSSHQVKRYSSKDLKSCLKKFWIMSETCDPQFAIAFSPVSCALGSLLKKLKMVAEESSSIEEYAMFVVQIEEEEKLSKRTIRNSLNSIARLLDKFEKKEPKDLMKLLEKSRGFNGVLEYDNDKVPPLCVEEMIHSCWSLVLVTLTATSMALPNIANSHFKGLLSGMKEGLQIVGHIEECLDVDGNFAKERKAARRAWTEVEVHHTWLQIDLQKKARKGKPLKEILQWLGDEAAKVVIQFCSSKKPSIDDSRYNFILASSMYRISQTILLRYNEQENWLNDEQLFEWISTIIADVLLACFTNLPCAIEMKCHHHSIEKRGDNIRSAAKLLGISKKILKILKARHPFNIDQDSMAYIDKWRAILKSQTPIGTHTTTREAPLTRIQGGSTNSNELVIVVVL